MVELLFLCQAGISTLGMRYASRRTVQRIVQRCDGLGNELRIIGNALYGIHFQARLDLLKITVKEVDVSTICFVSV